MTVLLIWCLKDKRYEQAIPEFEAFNQKYPNSSYAANAHYWLGQLLFNKGELAKARQEFDVVVNQFQIQVNVVMLC